MKTGTELIAEERQRQIKKWSADHDATHTDGGLGFAAAQLAGDGVFIPSAPTWAYNLKEKHRGDRIRQLQIAGALIAAEIDRLNNTTHAR